MSLNRKLFLRLRTILSAATFRITFLFSNLIISLLVITTASAELWGEVVSYILIVDLGFSVINWGHASYLIREFSLQPSQMHRRLWESLSSRSLLLLAFVAIIWLCPLPSSMKEILTTWAAARFLYQAFEAELQYHRKYFLPLVIEATGILIVVIPIILSWVAASTSSMLSLFAISFVFRAVAMLVYQRRLVASIMSAWTGMKLSSFFIPAFPFLLLTFSAMLQQRTDLYLVAYFLTPDDVAGYQVFVNLLLVTQFGASLLLSPFSKNIFRLPPYSFRKLERNFIRVGALLAILSSIAVFLVVRYMYGFNLPWTLYVMAYMYSVTAFVYLPKNYQLGKARRQATVALYSFAGFAVNFVLSVILTPRYGIEGAMLSALIAQLFTTSLYFRTRFSTTSYAAR